MSDTSSSTFPAPSPDSKTNNRLNARDIRVLLLWLLAGVIGAAIAYKYFFVAFPEASVDFKISRDAALGVARDFLTAQGSNLQAYQSSIVFEVDDDTKTYLERELGLARANQLMAGEVSTWFWSVRFFRPGQKEEFLVKVSPAGRVVGLAHEIEEARAGASLDQAAALSIATQFLEKRQQLDLAGYDFLPAEANSNVRPARRDWSFAWERRNFRAKDAPYRLGVTILGDQVGGYREFLKIPEAWQRDFQKLRSSNTLYQVVDQILYFMLVGASFWMLYDFARRGSVNWRALLKLAGVLIALFFLKDLNELPLARADYNTNTSYPGFFVLQIGASLLVGLIYGILVSVSVGAGEPLYRRDHPQRVRLNKLFTFPGIRSKEFFRSCVIGLCLAGFHLGFVVLFYMIGYKHGVWAPQDVPYSDVVNTAAPWLYPMTIGFFAATNEEFLFRLFAIPFLLRFTKSRILAVVLPAFTWGFLHSIYPQEPGYIRGLEVGLIGIVAGIVFLRWGILATLVWHYTVDAFLISMILLRSGSLYFRISGAIVGGAALIPLLLASISYMARRRFDDDESVLNSAPDAVAVAPPPAATAVEAKPQIVGYRALTPRTLWTVVACGVLGASLFAAVKVPTLGDFVRFSVNASQAGPRADEILRLRSPAAAKAVAWHRAVTLISTADSFTNEYLHRQIGIAGANDLYEKRVPSLFWRARYFRDSQKEEYWVLLRPDGSLHSVHHLLDEKAPGANLAKEDAQARAEAYLRDEKKMDLSGWKLIAAKSDKQPARTDHEFIWKSPETIGKPMPGDSEGAHVEVAVKVFGDEVAGYRVFVKTPDEWERKQSEQKLSSILYLVGLVAVLLAFAAVILVIFFRNLKDPAAAGIPWRRLARWAMWGLLAAAVSYANNFQTTLAAYDTQMPLKTFGAIAMIGVLLVIAFVFSSILFLFGLAWFFLSKAFGPECLPGWSGMSASYYRQAFWLTLGGAGILLGFSRVAALVQKIWPTLGQALDMPVPNVLGFALPASGSAASAGMRSLFVCAFIGIAGGFVARYARQTWMQAGLIVLGAIALTGEWGSPADYVKKLIWHLLFLLLVWLGVSRIVRFNLLAYFLLVAAVTLLPFAAVLLAQPNSFYRANGIAALAILAALLAWPLVAARGASADSITQAGSPRA